MHDRAPCAERGCLALLNQPGTLQRGPARAHRLVMPPFGVTSPGCQQPRVLQIVVAASRIRATLWDAFSGRFLGVLAVSGCPLDTPNLIDPGAGLPLVSGTGRAAASPEGTLPPLGTSGEDMLPGEDAVKLAHRLNTVAMTTSSIAKKCADPALRGEMSPCILC